MTRMDSLVNMREVLLRRRNAILQQIAVPDVDNIFDVLPDKTKATLADVDCRELTKIAIALARMHAGAYGICDHCGQEMPLARLTAVPYADSCMECQLLCDSEPLNLDATAVAPKTSLTSTSSPLLIITRRKNESLVLNDEITVVVVDIRGDKVRLGIEFPTGVSVQRGEVYEALRRQDAGT